MLRSLRLTNFRRHADTELLFTPDSQVIAITGPNGSGKTTLLEALTYALFGESRHGRRNLARMVRRGAEFEGMQVELSFTVGDVDYDLVRRYERGKTSATLMANSNLVMQSADGVTAEVTKILGMDAAGFRLAVIAQQFEIDGLADLTPARRRTTVTRLLRQDALTRAKLAASDEKNRQLDVVRAMGSGPDLVVLQDAVAAAEADLEATRAALSEGEAAVAELDRQLGQTAGIQAQWQDVQVELARADATLSVHTADLVRAKAELATIHVPDAPVAPAAPLARIVAELSEVNIAVANAEFGAELARTAEQTRSELERVEAALTKVTAQLGGDTPATVAVALATAEAAATLAVQSVTTARRSHAEAVEARTGPAGQLAALRALGAAQTELGETCDTCGQTISAAHRKRQKAERAAAEKALVIAVKDADAAVAAAAAELVRVEAAQAEARAHRDGLATRAQVVRALISERNDLNQRREAYTARLERIVVPDIDVDALYSRKGSLELAKAEAEQYEQQVAARNAATERRDRVVAAASQAQARVEAAQAAKDAAQPSAALVSAHALATELADRRAAEADLVGAVRVEVAGAAERVTAARNLVRGAVAQHERLREVRAGADRAAKTARLLDVVAERMATQIRPALEGAISDALNRLSEGRFTSVRLSDAYDITVLDDDDYQPLSELSGGERVLVALATRLALAEVVAGRHADGGLRVLVLDEIFGSQDAERREAIMSGLRALRSHYGQILLISHVGGLEEEADRVIDLSVSFQDGVRVAEATAA